MPQKNKIGITDKGFFPCPSTPNCVSSQETNPEKQITPLLVDPKKMTSSWKKLISVLENTNNCKILKIDSKYIHAVFTTKWLRFKDDVEFLMDAEKGMIHMKSASRIGRSDLGTNRKRLETIRQLFLKN